MKQRCWKQLKSQLCPPQRWVKDSEHSKCQCCAKQFMLLVRRRHHCRFCGNLFCSECSDYFINGNYIGQTNQKYIRHCQFCHKKIEKIIRELTKMPEIYDDKNDDTVVDDDGTDDEEEDGEMQFNLMKMFEEVGEINEELADRQNRILNEFTHALCEKFNLDQQVWKPKLINLAQRAANEAKMEVLVSEGSPEHSMDLSKTVKVKTIEAEKNKAVQAMVKGIVLEKNVTSKSMQTHLSHPKVLIIENSIDLDSLASFIKFEQLIKNDKAIMKKILQKIVKLNPDIIFVQNNVHVFALEYLQSKQIVVINKLKQKQLEMIKQVTGIKKSIKKLWMLEKYKHQCILGKCDKIYFKTVNEGLTLMFVQAGEMGIRTILLGEEQEQMTNNLKKSMKFLLRLARQLNLEKHFILIQRQLKDSINKKQCILTSYEDFSPLFYKNIESFSQAEVITYTKIMFYNIKLSQSPKNYQEYAHRMGKTSYKQVCGKIDFVTRRVYTSTDLTLGAYILMKAANYQRLCKKCENIHTEHYYIDQFVVTIETDRKVSPITKSSSSSFIEVQGEQFTLQKLKSHLTKQKEMIVISTYAKCQICSSIVGPDNTKVGKLLLSNSFHHVLQCLVASYSAAYQAYQEKAREEEGTVASSHVRKNSRRRLSIDRCQHTMLSRVYQYREFQTKISIDRITLYPVDFIDLTTKISVDHMTLKQLRFVRNLYEFELAEKNKILQKISAKVEALPFLQTSVTMSLAPSPKLAIYQQCWSKVKPILEECRNQLKTIGTKCVVDVEKGKHDWTKWTRKIYKVQSILQMIFIALDATERFLRKKKVEQNTTTTETVMVEVQQDLNQTENDQISQYSPANVRNSIASQSYLDEQTREYLKKSSKKIYPNVKGAFFDFYTANINDPVSMLAVGINNKILYPSESKSDVDFSFQMTASKKLKTQWPLHAQAKAICGKLVGDLPQKVQEIEITVYFHKQFESFRKQEGINNELYVRGLCSCKNWDSSGGKSNSLFGKAENDLLVVKVINEKQFEQFHKFAKDYLDYMKGRDTLLAKIFGIYEVKVKGKKIYKCVVMQNIFFGLQNIDRVYDLKGSEVNRLNLPPQGVKTSTGQDTNFRIDKQGEPYILHCDQYDKVIKILQQDSNFLKEHAVIDYSLLVIESSNSLRLGIIDYMRPYQLMQKLETIYKQLKSGRDPTVIPPISYAERFIGAMKKYFIKTQ